MNVHHLLRRFAWLAALAVAPAIHAQEGGFDVSWNGNGRRLVDFSSEMDVATHMLVAPDDKVLVAGWCGPASGESRTACVARLLPNGSLDTGFGTSADGMLQVNQFSGISLSHTAGLARGNDGALWLAMGITAASEILIWRLTEDGDAVLGSLAFHFSTLPTGPSSTVSAIRPASGNAMIVAGSMKRDDSGVREAAVMRLVLDGDDTIAIDPGFGTDGLARVPQGKAISDVVVLDDGRMLLSVVKAGSSNLGTTAVVMRLLADGTIDATFGVAGVAALPLCAGSFRGDGTQIAVDPHGRIAVGFTAEYRDANFNSLPSEICVNRLHPDGQQDGSFGGVSTPGGTGHPVRVNIGGSQYFESIAVGADSKIIVGGSHISDTGVPCSVVCFIVARLNEFPRTTSVLDPVFAGLGAGVGRFDNSADWNSGNALVIGNGGLMIAGYSANVFGSSFPERFGIAKIRLGRAAFDAVFDDGFE